MSTLLKGSLSGLAATWPMTATMLALRDRIPAEWFSSLPPRRITLRAARKTGILSHLGFKEREASAWISHFGFGAAAGALYSRLPGARRALPVWAGPLYGLAVWASAYLGFMPALGLHPSALRDRRSRTGLMIVSHLVWGLCLSAAFRLLGPARASGRRAGSEDIGTKGW